MYCRKCGDLIVENSNVCNKCGTVVLKEQKEKFFDNEISRSKEIKLNKNKRKRIIIILAVILLMIFLTTLGFVVCKLRINPQEINTINGCPEFYNLEFGMTAKEASSRIKLEHNTFEGLSENDFFEVEDYMKESQIFLKEGQIFKLYGKKAQDVIIGFDKKSLDFVAIKFSKKSFSLNEIIDLYKKIYGAPTDYNSISASWIGTKTTITVFELITDDGEDTIVVRYTMTPNSQYERLSFTGSELDPCGFLSNNHPFDKKPEYYINGLKEGEDYNKKVYSVEGLDGFSQYRLYPSFEYMGIENDYTAIEFNVAEGMDTIETAGYLFLLTEENAVDRMVHIYSKLLEKFGKEIDATYTSTYYDKLGIVDIDFSEMKNRIKNGTEGMYHIHWKSENYNVTLRLTIKVDNKYYEGSVSFAG